MNQITLKIEKKIINKIKETPSHYYAKLKTNMRSLSVCYKTNSPDLTELILVQSELNNPEDRKENYKQ